MSLAKEREKEDKQTFQANRTHSTECRSFCLFLRVTPEVLNKKLLEFPNSSYPAFSLPELPPETLPSNQSVDVRVSPDRCHFTSVAKILFSCLILLLLLCFISFIRPQ